MYRGKGLIPRTQYVRLNFQIFNLWTSKYWQPMYQVTIEPWIPKEGDLIWLKYRRSLQPKRRICWRLANTANQDPSYPLRNNFIVEIEVSILLTLTTLQKECLPGTQANFTKVVKHDNTFATWNLRRNRNSGSEKLVVKPGLVILPWNPCVYIYIEKRDDAAPKFAKDLGFIN